MKYIIKIIGKYIFCAVFFSIINFTITAQTKVFNRLITDTIAHITSSVIALDTGYVVLSGAENEYYVRSFALTYTDLDGNRVWKKTFGHSTNEYWEGWSNCLKRKGEIFYSTGTIKKPVENQDCIYIYIYDSIFNIKNHNILLCNNNYISGFNILQGYDKNFYLVGAIVDNDISKLLLVKTDSLGNYLWDKQIINRNYEIGGELINTTDNNILIGGLSSIFTTPPNQDWYLVKVDTAGEVIWQKTFGHNRLYDDNIKGLAETSDQCYLACGGYPVAGYSASVGNYLWDGCIRKINSNGQLIWEKMYRNYTHYPGGSTIDVKTFFKSMIVLDNKDIIVLANSYGYYPLDRGALMRLDSLGNIKWHRFYFAVNNLSREQYFSSIKPTNDGGYVIAGFGDDYSNIGYNPSQVMWLVKTDSLGMDGLSNISPDELNFDIDIPETVCAGDTINVYAYIAGKSAPYSIETSNGQSIQNIFYPPKFVPVEIGLGYIHIQKYGYEFSENITEATISNHQWGQCIVKKFDIIIPQSTGQQQIAFNITDAYGESRIIYKDVFIDDCETGINDYNLNKDIKIYPNPAKDVIYIDIFNNSFGLAEIYDLNGKIIFKCNIKQGTNNIDIKELKQGAYIIKVYNKNDSYSFNFEKI